MYKIAVHYPIERATVYNVASRIAEGMVAEVTCHAAAAVVEMFVPVVLQTIPFLYSGRDVAVLYIKAMQVKCLTSRLVVIVDLRDPTRCSE